MLTGYRHQARSKVTMQLRDINWTKPNQVDSCNAFSEHFRAIRGDHTRRTHTFFSGYLKNWLPINFGFFQLSTYCQKWLPHPNRVTTIWTWKIIIGMKYTIGFRHIFSLFIKLFDFLCITLFTSLIHSSIHHLPLHSSFLLSFHPTHVTSSISSPTTQIRHYQIG